MVIRYPQNLLTEDLSRAVNERNIFQDVSASNLKILQTTYETTTIHSSHSPHPQSILYWFE